MSRPSGTLTLRILAHLAARCQTVDQTADALGVDRRYAAVTFSRLVSTGKIIEVGRVPARKGPGTGIYALPGHPKLTPAQIAELYPPAAPAPTVEPRKGKSGVIAGPVVHGRGARWGAGY